MNDMNEVERYQVFVLRVQRAAAVPDGVAACLRLILEDTRTGERRVFGDGAALVTFLNANTPDAGEGDGAH